MPNILQPGCDIRARGGIRANAAGRADLEERTHRYVRPAPEAGGHC